VVGRSAKRERVVKLWMRWLMLVRFNIKYYARWAKTTAENAIGW
jgi:hypothetical protein